MGELTDFERLLHSSLAAERRERELVLELRAPGTLAIARRFRFTHQEVVDAYMVHGLERTEFLCELATGHGVPLPYVSEFERLTAPPIDARAIRCSMEMLAATCTKGARR